MKLIRTALCAALLALSLLLASACAAEGAGATALQTAKSSNMRKEPSRKSIIVEQLKRGARVEVLSQLEAEDALWAEIRVRKSGKKGFILMELLEPIPTPTPKPTPSPTPVPTLVPTATPEPTPTPYDDGISSVPGETHYEEAQLWRTLKRVNLRRTPGGMRLSEISRDERLTVLGEVLLDNVLWLHIEGQAGYAEGYIQASFARQIVPPVLIPVSEAEALEKYPVVPLDPLGDIKKEIPFAYTDEELAAYRSIQVGDTGNHILALRKRLYALGYYSKPNENTVYTKSTADVIRRFQADCGLEPTGIADPYTQALLFDTRMLPREGSKQEIQYLSNQNVPLFIQRAEITSHNYYGSIQVSVRNQTGAQLTRFGLTIIPNMSDGTLVDMAPTFAEQIEKDYSIRGIRIANQNSYSDFYVYSRDSSSTPSEPLFGFENVVVDDDYVPEHHFEVAYQQYFSGAQVAVRWYRANRKTVRFDDDQLVFIAVGKGSAGQLIHTLPIEVSAQEREAGAWAMGMTTNYVLPTYQAYYHLPQGAYIRQVEEYSPAYDCGLQSGDIIVGIDDQTILGDATLCKARARIEPDGVATIVFWRNGEYFSTEFHRPPENVEP